MTEETTDLDQSQPEPSAAASAAAAEPAGAALEAAQESAAEPQRQPGAAASEPPAPAAGASEAPAAAKPKPQKQKAPKTERPPKAEGKPKEGKGKAAGRPAGKAKAEKPKAPPEEKLPPRLKVRYQAEIVPALMRELGLDNPMEVPRLRQVVINMGVGVATQDPKALEGAVRELSQITGQRPAITRARKSIAAFKVRENNPVGCRVTLRGDRMYEFLDRLFNAALPRIRDFRGLPPRSFDGRGNYTMGIREQLIFPELSIDEIERVRGMDITITTTARTDEAGRALLTKLGLPLRES